MCLEAASLGMPFEVWKTRMGKVRNEGTAAVGTVVPSKGENIEIRVNLSFGPIFDIFGLFSNI